MWMKLYLFDEDLEIQKVISKKDPVERDTWTISKQDTLINKPNRQVDPYTSYGLSSFPASRILPLTILKQMLNMLELFFEKS